MLGGWAGPRGGDRRSMKGGKGFDLGKRRSVFWCEDCRELLLTGLSGKQDPGRVETMFAGMAIASETTSYSPLTLS